MKDLLRQLARVGAQARVDALLAEAQQIRKLFPDLGEEPANGAVRPKKRMATSTLKPAKAADGRKRKRRPFTAARRREIAAQMKAFWARKREAKAEKQIRAERKERVIERPVHWTQTEAGKRKMAKVARMRHKRGDFGHRAVNA